MEKQPVKIFISYSRKDRSYKEDLVEFLAPMRRQGIVEAWSDKDIVPGEVWEDELLEELAATDIIIFLVSPSFLNSDYIDRVEIQGAMERHKTKEVVLVPVVIRPCDFESSDLKSFMALPTDAKPVSNWNSNDSAWMDVVGGLKRVIERIRERKQALPSEPSVIENNTPVQPESIPNQAIQLISEYESKKAINLLLDYTQKNDLSQYNDLILQSSRFNGLAKQQNQGIISREHYDMSLSRIHVALQSIIEDIKNK